MDNVEYELFFYQRTREEGHLPVGVKDFGDIVGIGNLFFFFKRLKFLNQVNSIRHREILIDESSVGFGLRMFQQINFIKEVEVGHFKVDHRGQGHHAEGDELVEVVHEGAVEELEHTWLDDIFGL